jgi:formate--tetrahydrofolate ligase
VKSDLSIAREIELRPILDLAAEANLAPEDLIPYGHFAAKIPVSRLREWQGLPEGKLILVTAMTPPKRGAGKTTTTVGLAQAMNRLPGRRAVAAIREPSLGPCMGMKGGAAGGGYAQVLPMEEINLHFTGDIHAVTMAHNLCAALLDNHLHQRARPEIHPRGVAWKRAIDMNDRSLRHIVIGMLEGGINGVLREDGFEITAASEIMAILCLADGMADLKKRMARIIVGYDSLGGAVTAGEIGAPGAMAALLKNAIHPNLVQTTEAGLALVHGGPFANIAHGCNSLLATRMAMKLGHYAITEAGFGADLGAEKFINIKCRAGGLRPSAVVVVVPRAAYAQHGIGNLAKHVENLRGFGAATVVSINRFAEDDPADLERIRSDCADRGMEAIVCDFRERGSDGGMELAERLQQLCEGPPPELSFTYELDQPIAEKIEAVATSIYGACGVAFSGAAKKQIQRIEDLGYGGLPVCMAKTPMSLTDDPAVPGRPEHFTISVSAARVSAGAGFVVAYTGKVMTMPGLPKEPAARQIDIDENGVISGLF